MNYEVLRIITKMFILQNSKLKLVPLFSTFIEADTFDCELERVGPLQPTTPAPIIVSINNVFNCMRFSERNNCAHLNQNTFS